MKDLEAPIVVGEVTKEEQVRVVRVHYDTQTNLVIGLYPSWVAYKTIPEPYAEISEEAYNARPRCNQWVLANGELKKYIHTPSLTELKKAKIQELERYYTSDQCWLFTIKYKGNSLTKTAEWFGRMIPATAGFDIILLDNKGHPQSCKLSEEAGKKINNRIQAQASFAIANIKYSVIASIQKAKTKKEITGVNIKKELDVVPRTIDLEKL